jgi:hypothetical protein
VLRFVVCVGIACALVLAVAVDAAFGQIQSPSFDGMGA